MTDPADQPEPATDRALMPDSVPASGSVPASDPASDSVPVPVASGERPTRPAADEDVEARKAARKVAEWVALVALALTAAFLLRMFVVQSFYIPSESMEPTLQVGDRVLVNKLAYRFGDPARGDIVVFDAPPGEGSAQVHDLIKRVIGLPGETVEGRDGKVYVEGEPIDEDWLPEGTRSRDFGPVEVPDDRYWVLGDNRSSSRDSTFFKSIPRDTIVGEAFVTFWPFSRFGFI